MKAMLWIFAILFLIGMTDASKEKSGSSEKSENSAGSGSSEESTSSGSSAQDDESESKEEHMIPQLVESEEAAILSHELEDQELMGEDGGRVKRQAKIKELGQDGANLFSSIWGLAAGRR